jgi:hypothetical protein
VPLLPECCQAVGSITANSPGLLLLLLLLLLTDLQSFVEAGHDAKQGKLHSGKVQTDTKRASTQITIASRLCSTGNTQVRISWVRALGPC